ncbi:PhnD/SsuA/transferrin family substrate-binding protein [Desulfonatronovibrio magnus]|uniref:PhnD/SsuA/transferrin family substrate-binding protein n=1 Tax=Desulfonatronovibrio magnus TaxID=698827 RepID=UPI000698E773|nr:PhnD/SsuA/transferrin family substrate-binding protein [Desulfonatronovibrio magnus]
MFSANFKLMFFMPSLLIVFLVVLLVLLLSPKNVTAQSDLVYSPLPLTNPNSVIAQSMDIVQYIEQNLDLKVEIQYEHDYATILGKFARDEIHLVHLGPLPFIMLKALAPHAEPVIFFREPDGRTSYTCSLATAIDNSEDPATTQGPIALPQPLSTCGFLTTSHLLRAYDTNLQHLPYTFLDSHEAVAQALVRGEFALGGLKSAIGQSYDQIGLQLLKQGPELPGFAMVANARVMDEKLRTELATILTEIPDDIYSQWQGLGQWGMSKAGSEDYCDLLLLDGIEDIPDCGDLDCTLLKNALEDICAIP